MANKTIGVNLDFDLNQLLNARVENGTGFASGGAGSRGRIMFDTANSRLLYDDGAQLLTVANLNDVAGLLDFKGGYNATTNVPDLTSGVGVLKGDYYVVTTAGTFYGQVVEIGDSLLANVDAPITLAGWTLVQGNVVYASTTVAGVIQLATQTEVNTGTNATKAVTPSTIFNANWNAKKYTSPSTTLGGGLPVTITHNLGNAKPVISIVRDSTGDVVTLAIDNFTANSFDVTKNGANANYTIGVVG